MAPANQASGLLNLQAFLYSEAYPDRAQQYFPSASLSTPTSDPRVRTRRPSLHLPDPKRIKVTGSQSGPARNTQTRDPTDSPFIPPSSVSNNSLRPKISDVGTTTGTDSQHPVDISSSDEETLDADKQGGSTARRSLASMWRERRDKIVPASLMPLYSRLDSSARSQRHSEIPSDSSIAKYSNGGQRPRKVYFSGEEVLEGFYQGDRDAIAFLGMDPGNVSQQNSHTNMPQSTARGESIINDQGESRAVADPDATESESSSPIASRPVLKTASPLKSQRRHSERQLIQPLTRKGRRGRPKKPDRPPGLMSDSSGRPYHMIIGKRRRLEMADGALFPSNYEKATGTGLPYVCPIRSCRLAFMKISTIGKHFRKHHYKCLLNDNEDGTFSIIGEYVPKRKKTAGAVVQSRRPPDPGEPPMMEVRSERQALRFPLRQAPRLETSGESVRVDEKENDLRPETQTYSCPGMDENSKELEAMPARLKQSRGLPESALATRDRPSEAVTIENQERPYNRWPVKNKEKMVYIGGALLPSGYKLATEFPGFEWICPIRTCRRLFPTIPSLNGHCRVSHRSTFLNDNLDGTLSIIRSCLGPTRVISKSERPLADFPMIQPNPTPFEKQIVKNRLEQAAAQHEIGVSPVASNAAVGGVEESSSSSLSSPISSPELIFSTSDEEPMSSRRDDKTKTKSTKVPDVSAKSTCLEFQDSNARETWVTMQQHLEHKKDQPPEGLTRSLMLLPRLREIQYVTTPNRLIYEDKWPKDVACLVVQMTGEESPVQCTHCTRGRGPFKDCILLSQRAADGLQAGWVSCVNCAFKSRHYGCDVVELIGARERQQNHQKASGKHASAASAEPITRESSENGTAVDRPGSHTRLKVSQAEDTPAVGRRSERLVIKETAVIAEERQNSEANNERSQLMFPNLPVSNRHSPQVSMDFHDDSEQEGVLEEPLEGSEPIVTGIQSDSKSHRIHRDRQFAFEVCIIPPGTAHPLKPEKSCLRIHSVVEGKLLVQLNGEPEFIIGAGGMFKVLPGAGGLVVNGVERNVIVHVHSII